jgi:hypothetical protein
MRFLSSSEDKTARLWDIRTGRQLLVFSGHAAAVNRATFVAEDSLIVTAADDNSVAVWPVEAPSRVRFLRGHADTGAFSGVNQILEMQGNRVLTFGSDGAARVWDLLHFVAEDVLTPPDGLATGVALNPARLSWRCGAEMAMSDPARRRNGCAAANRCSFGDALSGADSKLGRLADSAQQAPRNKCWKVTPLR